MNTLAGRVYQNCHSHKESTMYCRPNYRVGLGSPHNCDLKSIMYVYKRGFVLQQHFLTQHTVCFLINLFTRLDLVGNLSLVTIITSIYQQNLVIARTGRAAKTVTRASKLMQASHFSNILPIIQVVKVLITIHFHWKLMSVI